MNHIKDILDGAAITVAAGVIFKLIPVVAGVLSIVWTGMRIYDWIKGKRNGNE